MKEFPALEDDSFVYRAVGYKDWIDKDGKIKWQAFKRSKRDRTGVSVAFSPEDADSQMNDPIFGMAELIVGDVRQIKHEEITLDVVQDKPEHAEIRNIPYIHNLHDNERLEKEKIMQNLCMAIRDKAKQIEYTPIQKISVR